MAPVNIDLGRLRGCSIPINTDSVTLGSTAGTLVESADLTRALTAGLGRESVTSVSISKSVVLRDLSWLESLPKVRVLDVVGAPVESLQGIEKLAPGAHLLLSAAAAKLPLQPLAGAGLADLRLRPTSALALECIRSMPGLQSLTLDGAEDAAISLDLLPQAAHVAFVNCRLRTLDVASGHGPERLSIRSCPRLERLDGNDSDIRWLLLDAAPRFPLWALSRLRELEHLAGC